MAKNNKAVGILEMTVCATLWSIAGLFIKMIDMDPLVIAGGRSLFAILPVVAFMAARRMRFVLTKQSLLSGAFLCALFLAFVGATKNTTAANAIVLQYTAPVFVLLFSVIFLHKKLRLLDVFTVLLTMAGVAVFFLDQMDAGQWLGNLLGIMAGVFMAVMFLAVGEAEKEEKMSGILLGHIFCAAVGLPFALFTENTFDARGVGVLALLGVVQLGIPYILYALATERCSVISCVVIAALEPILNPILVAIFLGERPGALAICAGVFLVAVITAYSVLDGKSGSGT
ncbi:MAG: DMT family transporter [Clostridia bacterium]|nr:DMT family transporter [Clostridia bacterium]